MEVHRQTCQNCGSIDVRNILAREEGHDQTVFVRCASCGELVARYRLRDYYHHGKGLDSFLRSHGSQAMESGRAQLAEFERTQQEAVAAYQQVVEQLHEEEKEI